MTYIYKYTRPRDLESVFYISYYLSLHSLNSIASIANTLYIFIIIIIIIYISNR